MTNEFVSADKYDNHRLTGTELNTVMTLLKGADLEQLKDIKLNTFAEMERRLR